MSDGFQPDLSGGGSGSTSRGDYYESYSGLNLHTNEELQLQWMGGSEFTPAAFQHVKIPFGRLQPGQGAGNLGRYGLRQALLYPQQLGPDKLQQLQTMLWYAGYYGEDAVRNGVQPAWGDEQDAATQTAWVNLIKDSIAQGGKRLDELLSERTDAFATVINDANTLDPLPDQVITVEDPATIRQWLDDNSQEIIGRKVDDETKAMLVNVIQERQRQMQLTQVDVEQRNQREELGYNDPAPATPNAPGMFPKTFAPRTVFDVGTQLARQYGLTVGSWTRTPEHNRAIGGATNSDHLSGMAVDISGSREQMEALGAWASQNEGPGKLFRWVGWKDDANHFDHVHLSFNASNDGNTLGTGITVTNDPAAMGGQGDGIDAFMAAIRSVESSGNYEVINSIGARGAYQFMPGTWSGVNREFGGDASDWSPAHQDDMARRKMLQYYQMFGDWQSVAVAWFAGPGRVAAFKAGRAGNMSDGNATVPEYVQKVMERMGNPDLATTPSGAITEIENVDVASQLEQELRERFPTETGAHDVATTFADFSSLFGGSPSSSSGLGSPSIGANL